MARRRERLRGWEWPIRLDFGGNEIPPSGGGSQEWLPHFNIGGNEIPPSDSKDEGQGAFDSVVKLTASWPAR